MCIRSLGVVNCVCCPTPPILLPLVCLNACQKSLAHFVEQRNLQPFHQLLSAQVSVDGTLGGVKIRRIVDELCGLWPQCPERCYCHRNEMQLRCGYQLRTLGNLLFFFGCSDMLCRATVEPDAGCQRMRHGNINGRRVRCRPPVDENVGGPFASVDLYFVGHAYPSCCDKCG